MIHGTFIQHRHEPMTPSLNMFDVKTIDHDLVIERKITSGHSRCPKCAKSLTLCTRSTLYPRRSLNHMLGCFGMSQKPLKIFSTKMSQVTMQLSECSLSTSIKFATWGNFKSYTLLQNIAGSYMSMLSPSWVCHRLEQTHAGHPVWQV